MPLGNGVIATVCQYASDNWQVQAGLHNGWNQLDGTSDHMGVIGGVKYTKNCQNYWSSFVIPDRKTFKPTLVEMSLSGGSVVRMVSFGMRQRHPTQAVAHTAIFRGLQDKVPID